MIVNKHASPRTLGSDLARMDAHVVKPVEYKELPELTDDMLSRAVVKKGGVQSPLAQGNLFLCVCRWMLFLGGEQRDLAGKHAWQNVLLGLMLRGRAVILNMSAHTDTQPKTAASRHWLRAGGLQR